MRWREARRIPESTFLRVRPLMEAMDSIEARPAQSESAEYGPEVLCASWNPFVTALTEPAGDGRREFVAELAAADAEALLARFYRFQRG